MDLLEFKKILFAVRKMEILTPEQITSINKMDNAQREEIVKTYNDVIKGLTNFIVNHL
jgi:hypothetical protein